uniref:VWFA domain-containing protein n=1 Tax=Strongyloides stercoralis TaxID=6248 RepID=A0A0K0EAS5_STRER
MEFNMSFVNNCTSTFGIAKEIYVKMSKNYKISRSTRAQWFFENINKYVKIEDIDENDESKMFTICGIIPEDNYDDKDDLMGKYFKIIPNTRMSYLSEIYRQVFILDMSPSSNVLIDHSGNVMNDRIFPAMKNCLTNTLKPFKLPGTKKIFQPKIMVTVAIFNPFLSLPSNQVLIQGILISNENELIKLFDAIEKKMKKLSDEQCLHGTNFISTFQDQRKKLVETSKEISCKEVIENTVVNPNSLFMKYQNFSKKEYNKNVGNNFLYDNEFKKYQDEEPSVFQEKHYLKSSWSLLFMLRLGLIGSNMLVGNSSSNIIIITDGVCGVPDMTAVQNILRKLRASSISCSFILIKGKNEPDPSFGHTTHFETLQFFAVATFGSFLYDSRSKMYQEMERNYFHKSLLVWSFQRALQTGFVAEQLVKKYNPKFLNYKNNYEFLHRCLFNHYRNKQINLLIFVRSREGFTIKDIDIEKYQYQNCNFGEKNEINTCDVITITMCQPWKPEINIEYVITGPWYGTLNKNVDVTVEIFIRAPFDFVTSLIANECTGHKRYSQILNSYQSLNNTLQDIVTSDKLMFRLNTFDKKKLYKIPESINCYDLFASRGIIIKTCSEDNIRMDYLHNTFIKYWKLVSELDNSIWQSWMHIYHIRVVLHYDIDIPRNLFTKKENNESYDFIKSDKALTVLSDYFKDIATITLVDKQSYVFFDIFINSITKKEEKYYYLIKFSGECPHLIINVAFLSYTPSYVRQKNINDIKEKISQLTMDIESQLLEDFENKWWTKSELIKINDNNDCDISSIIILFKNAIEYYKKPQLLQIEYNKMCESESILTPLSSEDISTFSDNFLDENSKFSFDDYPISFKTISILEIIHKPIEKFLVKYNNIPNYYEKDISVDDLNIDNFRSEDILNKALLKYLCCHKYIYKVSSPHRHIQCMNKKGIEFLLQTILYQKLNQGFSIAYGSYGIVNVIRQSYKKYNKMYPRVQQVIIKTPENVKNVIEDETFLFNNYLCNKNGNINDSGDKCYKTDTCISNEIKNFDFQLTLEVWNEPDDCIDDDENLFNDTSKNNNQKSDIYKKELCPLKILDDGDNIIKCLLTIDLLFNSIKRHIFTYEAPLQLKEYNDCKRKEDRGNDEQYIKIFLDSYDIERLCQFSPEKIIILFPVQYCDKKYDDAEDRFKNLFYSLHNELSNDFHGCIRQEGIRYWENDFDGIKNIIKMENDINFPLFENEFKLNSKLNWENLLKNKNNISKKKEMNKNNDVEVIHDSIISNCITENDSSTSSIKCYMRYYVKQLSYTSLIILSLPEKFEDIMKINNFNITKFSTIPLFAHFIDETFLASSLSQNIPILNSCPLIDLRFGKLNDKKINELENCINQYREKVKKNTIVFNNCNPRGGYNKPAAYTIKFNFLNFIIDLDEVVYTRAFISSAFKTICEIKYVPDYIIKEMIEEKCHIVRKELSFYEEKLKKFCKHYKNYCIGEYFEKNKCYEENNEFHRQFNIILDSHNFTKTKCLKDYYIYNGILKNCNEIISNIHKNDCYEKDNTIKKNSNFKKHFKKISEVKNESISSGSVLFANDDENDCKCSYLNYNDYEDIDDNSTSNEIDDIMQEKLKETFYLSDCISNSILSPKSLKNEITTIISHLDVLTPPLFIQFICALLIPGEEMITFPITTFPNCILDIFEQVPIKYNINNLMTILDNVKVSIDLYIFTKPKRETIEIQRRNKLLPFPIPLAMYKKHSYLQINDNINTYDGISSSDDERGILNIRNEWKEIDTSAVKIIKNFFSDINYLINSEEYFLMLKNKSKIYDKDDLRGICNFVETLSKKETNLENGRYKYICEPIKMISKDNTVFNCIQENLTNLNIEYIKLKKSSGFNDKEVFFYSSEIFNKGKFMRKLFKNRKISLNDSSLTTKLSNEKINDTYKESINDTSKGDILIPSLFSNDIINEKDINNTIFSSEDESQIDSLYTDFWIVIYMNKKKIKMMLIQRSPETHTKLFLNLVKIVKEIILKNNQKKLLNDMYKKKKVDERLINLYNNSDIFIKNSNAGLYACNIVSFHYFFIHYRLRIIPVGMRGKNTEINYGLDVLENCLMKYECDDSKIFVCKDENDNVFFMKFLLNDDIVNEIPNNNVNNILNNYENTRDKILLGIYGCQKPGPIFLNKIINLLTSSLREETLYELSKAIYETKYMLPFNPEDIKYLQPNFKSPNYTFCYGLPKDIYHFIYSLNYFLLQHLELFFNQPRYGKAEYLAFCHHLPRKFSHDFYTLNIQDIFMEWVNPNDNIHEKADILSNFYYTNRYSPSGKFPPGIAVIELRLLDGKTKQSAKITDLYNSHIFDVNKEYIEEYRKNIKYDNESLKKISQCVFSNDITNLDLSYSYIIQFNIWESGNTEIERIKIKLDHVVQQSVFDVYTEYIFLQKKCFESELMYESTPDLSPDFFDYNNINEVFIREKSKTIAVPKRSLNKQQSLIPQTILSLPKFSYKNKKSQSLQDLKSINYYGNSNLLNDKNLHNINGVKINQNSEINSESGGTEEISNKSIFADNNIDEREYVDLNFLLGIVSWFDYVNDINNGYDKSKSYRKLEMRVDSCISIDTSYEIIAKKIFETSPPEDLVLSQAYYKTKDDRRRQAKLRVIENDLEPISKYSLFYKEGEEHKQSITHAAMLFDFKMQKEILEYMYCLKGKVPKRIAYNYTSNASYKEKRFPSSLNPFVSRQRILLIIIKGNLVTYYFYNFAVEITDILIKSFSRTLQWHDAKAKLNNEIHLQKLGYFHIVPTRRENNINNSYELLITYDPYTLSENDYPPNDLDIINYNSYQKAFMRGIRLMYRQNFLFDIEGTSKCSYAQVNQYLDLRGQLYNKILRSTKAYDFYETLINGKRIISRCMLNDGLKEYTRIHFVNTPILLFESWRNQISNARVPPSKIKSTIILNNFRQPEMYVLKIQYMMVKEFSQYFNELGWENLWIEDITNECIIKNNQSLEYYPHCTEPPNIWMVQVMKYGVLLANIYFKKPYLSVHIYAWELHCFYNNMKGLYINNDIYNYEDMKNFENIKDEVISIFHLHSFSYDYHLRIGWKYMLSREHLIFPNDYNVPLFLFNLLKYYEYRPPYSRNALYEIIIENKNLKIQPDCVWEKLLDSKQKSSKMVVRFQRNDYMIVEEETIPIYKQMYKVITVMLRAPVKSCPRSQLNIRVFKILINIEEKFPLIKSFTGNEEIYNVENEIGGGIDSKDENEQKTSVIKFSFPSQDGETKFEDDKNNEDDGNEIITDINDLYYFMEESQNHDIVHEICTIEKLCTSSLLNDFSTINENNDELNNDSETNCFGLKMSVDLVSAIKNQENIPPSILNDSITICDDSIITESNDIFDFLFEEDIYETGVCPQIEQDDNQSEEFIDDNLLGNHNTIKITSDVADISHSLSNNQQLLQKILAKMGEDEIMKIVKDTNECELCIRRQRFWELLARKRFLPKKNKMKNNFKEKSMEFIFPQKVGQLHDLLNRRLINDEVEELYDIVYKNDEKDCLKNIDKIYNMSKIMKENVYHDFLKFIKLQYNRERTRFIHGIKNTHFIYIPNDEDDFGVSFTLNANKSIKLWIISKKERQLNKNNCTDAEKVVIDRYLMLFDNALELILKFRHEYKIDV